MEVHRVHNQVGFNHTIADPTFLKGIIIEPGNSLKSIPNEIAVTITNLD